MSKTETHGQKKWKLLLIIPIVSLLFVGTACFNAQNDEYVVAVSPTKMNVLYMGVDNPVSIAVTGADYGKETATLDNGSINGKNGNYTVRVTKPGVVTISVKLGDKIVSEQKFRVKKIPDPRAIIKGNYGKTSFSKQELKDAGGIAVLLENFDFDIEFDVIEFGISAVVEGYAYEARANNSNFSKQQIELIDKLEEGQKFYIEGIMVKAPDGTSRRLGAFSCKIK
jgi:gliding motility-associated protein GldM